jgi:VIT1/CCC1 family predicted Fe2+/Mn2+ transporter
MTTASGHGRHDQEPHALRWSERHNWLRAGVLGANDGIVSVAAIVVGVAAATDSLIPIASAGVAALVGGAISMALGEYVSVSSARDSQRSLIAKEERELAEMPEQELAELTQMYIDKGLSRGTATQVAEELTARDALAAHLEVELNISTGDVLDPWVAARASALAFLVGGVLPLVCVLVTPVVWRVPATGVLVLAALAATGALGAYLGRSPKLRPTLRVVVGGALALVATYGIGSLFGAGVG